MSGARSSPFSPRVALAMVLVGALGFIALLWAVGSGMADPDPQPSGAHASGKGLVGFEALADYLKARDYQVSATRTRGAHHQGGLLVLTPLHGTKPEELTRTIAEHRDFGPTLLIMPKWRAMPFPPTAQAINPKVHPGFVKLDQAIAPEWKGFHDEVNVDLSPLEGAAATQTWRGAGLNAPLPVPAWICAVPPTVIRTSGLPTKRAKAFKPLPPVSESAPAPPSIVSLPPPPSRKSSPATPSR